MSRRYSDRPIESTPVRDEIGRLRFALWKGADWPSSRKWGRNGGRSHFSKIGQNEFKNGVYISGLSLLNTSVRLRPTGSGKSHLPTTFLAHRKSRLEQWLQRQVTSFDVDRWADR
jgi:hypothetical protein